MKTMRALVKAKAGEGVEMQEVPVPEPGPTDVLIRIHKNAVCGTDLHIYNWDEWAQRTIKPPMVVGHEFSGKVAALGSAVKGFEEGDIVSGEGHIVCGSCRNCLAGRRHLCRNTIGIGVNRDGAMAEYLCMPATNVWKAHPSIPMETLAYFDPLGNATHTALTYDLVGEDVLITGAGPIGIMAAAIARHVGARYVVITDVNHYRLTLARKMGVTLAVDVTKDRIEDAQAELEMKEGFDVGMEMSGHPDAFRGMLANMCTGGRIAQLGILPKDMGIDWDTVIFHSLNIRGIYGREMFETWYKMTSMLMSGLDVSPILTHRFRAEDYAEAFGVMRTGHCGKVLLEWL
ncbi:MAG: L-threonine 3-dehydrogenase [Planctomycetes bacterium]|nr:L-threonine 3-dehydrogenase [Planctomycetota bacterium]